jgi:hypothetical protein
MDCPNGNEKCESETRIYTYDKEAYDLFTSEGALFTLFDV